MEKMLVLSLTLLAVSRVYSDGHSLQHYETVVSAPGSGLPEFSAVGYVDDQQIMNYTSDIGRAQPMVPWMEKVEDGYWERETRTFKHYEALAKYFVRTEMINFNQTGGFHIAQRMSGCELRDDGSIIGNQQFAYDGKDFITLDMKTGKYFPIMVQAEITTQIWNSPEVKEGERWKNYLENSCIEYLQKYVKNGRKDLERRVRPRVKVSGQEKGDTMKLHCQVYGFHPRAVDVRWIKNGEDEVPSNETTHVLPNPDGTYQIRVSAEVTPKEGDRYSCYVDHSSLEEPLNIVWEPNHVSTLAIIISVAVIVIIIVVALIFVGVIIFKKRRKKFVRSNSKLIVGSAEFWTPTI